MNSADKGDIIKAIDEEIRIVKPGLAGAINPTDNLVDDCGMESLDIVELVARIEARFRIPIDDDQYRKLLTVESIADFILTHSTASA